MGRGNSIIRGFDSAVLRPLGAASLPPVEAAQIRPIARGGSGFARHADAMGGGRRGGRPPVVTSGMR